MLGTLVMRSPLSGPSVEMRNQTVTRLVDRCQRAIGEGVTFESPPKAAVPRARETRSGEFALRRPSIASFRLLMDSSDRLNEADVFYVSTTIGSAPRLGVPRRVSASLRRDSLVHRAYGAAHQHAQMGDAWCGGRHLR